MKKTFVTIDPSVLPIGPDAPFRYRRFLPGEERPGAGSPAAGTARRADDDALARSIGRCGLLHPPLILAEPGDGPPAVVCGHRRVAAARIAGIESIEAISLAAPRTEAIAPWLEEARFGSPLSDLELVILMSKCRALSGDRFSDATEHIFRVAGRSLSPSYIDRALRLLELPDDVLDALHDGRLSTGDLLALSESEAIDPVLAARLIAGAELKRAERREAVRLLLRLGDLGIRGDVEESSGEGGRGLLPALRAACTPSLERDMGRIDEIVARLGLPAGASLQPPENLEGGHYRFTARIRDERELEELLGKLQAALDRGDIERLIDILKGNRQ